MPKRHFETPAALPADAFFGGKFMTHVSPNENKMSDGGQGRVSLGVGVWKSSQKWSVQRSAVRSIAWLGSRGLVMGEYTECKLCDFGGAMGGGILGKAETDIIDGAGGAIQSRQERRVMPAIELGEVPVGGNPERRLISSSSIGAPRPQLRLSDADGLLLVDHLGFNSDRFVMTAKRKPQVRQIAIDKTSALAA